jgi:hypothetical protein
MDDHCCAQRNFAVNINNVSSCLDVSESLRVASARIFFVLAKLTVHHALSLCFMVAI